MDILKILLQTPEGSRGTGPAIRCEQQPSAFDVGRGPVPRHLCRLRLPDLKPGRASIGTRNGLGWRVVFARVECSRGTGPRATGQGWVLLAMRRSGAGAPELQSLVHARDRGGQAPALRTHLANLANLANPAHIL